MTWLLAAAILIMVSGVPGLFLNRRTAVADRLFCILALAGCCVGGGATLAILSGALPATLILPWHIPDGAFALTLDPVAALFVLPLLMILGAGSYFGTAYWSQTEHPRDGRKLKLFYGLIGAAILVLLLARNGLLFLVAWEVMALSGFFLITTEDHKSEVRRAGLIYLAATHTGTLALCAFFVMMASSTGGFDFPAVGTLSAAGTPLFLLGLFGFGLKAGLMPLHIWLPGAHAAAPSHASAILSGVMIKTGIYGLVRMTSFFATIPPWWGWTILLLGAVSGVFGVALAIAQHDIKRLLAYHSVENIGIIALGLGLALLGRSYQVPELTLLGMAGALLHVVNHGLFKSLLFLSAGSMIHAVGSRDIDRLGGLLRRMPWTGICFLGGAVAICGLPPFNGFVSEWLVYRGAFDALQGDTVALRLAALAAPALALIGALAIACFVKVFGVVFLGEARHDASSHAHEGGMAMRLPQALLLAACVWIGLLPTTVAPLLERAAVGWAPQVAPVSLAAPLAPLGWIGACGWILLAALALVGSWMAWRCRFAPRDIGTWGCGYARPTPRMQYSASSFADFLVGLFRFGLRTERHGGRVSGTLPAAQAFSSHTPDAVLDRLLLPLITTAAWFSTRVRALMQNGQIPFYLLYVGLTLLLLLALTLP